MNIVITWPKDRPLRSYVNECARASEDGDLINFRLPTRPNVEKGERCYVVYAGFIRGWHEIVDVVQSDQVRDPVTNDLMPFGIYVVRDPLYHPMMGAQIAMRGFQGFRYAKAPL